MATTAYGVNAPEAVKLWSKRLAREALKKTYIGKFIGSGDDALIQEKKDTKKSEGDRIRTTLRMQLGGAGVVGDGTLEGNEESLTTYTDDLLIDQLRHAVRSGGKMTEQRIPFSIREEARTGLTDWWAGRMDRAFFMQVCGFNAGAVTERGENYDGTDLRYTGQNAILAPESTAHYRLDATSGLVSGASDEDLVSADTMTLTILDDLKAEAETRSPVVRPVMINGEKHYCVFLDVLQARDLRKNTNTGQWQDIQKAAMQGGQISKNPIFNGSLGMYNNMILHSTTRISQGVHSSTSAAISTVRRAVLCGAQSSTIAFGKGHSFDKMGWHEETFDYGNQLGVSSGCIFGIKKNRWNSKDFSTLVLSTYAA